MRCTGVVGWLEKIIAAMRRVLFREKKERKMSKNKNS
jgi:hypothetical protein